MANGTGVSSLGPADAYQEFFVPALFQEWAERVADAADLIHGERVLDVGCGTGVLARAVLNRVGSRGLVVGLDPRADMLDVARRYTNLVEYQEGRAEQLPFANESFDVVVSQFGLMYFEDQRAAILEMMRVLRPGGRIVVAVFDRLNRSPGYAALAALVHRLFGDRIADAMRAPYVLGDAEVLHGIFADAGIPNVRITTREGTVRFPSVQALILTERACAGNLGRLLDATQFDRLQKEVDEVLRPFVLRDGSIRFAAPAHLVRATKPRVLGFATA